MTDSAAGMSSSPSWYKSPSSSMANLYLWTPLFRHAPISSLLMSSSCLRCVLSTKNVTLCRMPRGVVLQNLPSCNGANKICTPSLGDNGLFVHLKTGVSSLLLYGLRIYLQNKQTDFQKPNYSQGELSSWTYINLLPVSSPNIWAPSRIS